MRFCMTNEVKEVLCILIVRTRPAEHPPPFGAAERRVTRRQSSRLFISSGFGLYFSRYDNLFNCQKCRNARTLDRVWSKYIMRFQHFSKLRVDSFNLFLLQRFCRLHDVHVDRDFIFSTDRVPQQKEGAIQEVRVRRRAKLLTSRSGSRIFTFQTKYVHEEDCADCSSKGKAKDDQTIMSRQASVRRPRPLR